MNNLNSPTLHTPRLILRPYRAGDWAAVHDYAADPAVVKHMLWGPNDEAASRDFIQRMLTVQQENSGREFHFAILQRAQQRLIGGCSLVISGAESRQGWIGYVLRQDVWGRGLATEAALGLLKFGFHENEMHRIYATCRPENHASARVLEKIGMRREGRLRQNVWMKGGWRDSLLYAILAHEWRAGQYALLFDMDGVLADTEPIYYAANQRLFRELGFEVTPEEYAPFVGLAAEKMWAQLKDQQRLPHPLGELVEKEKQVMYTGLLDAELIPPAGLMGLLETAQKSGYRLGLASTSSHKIIGVILEKLGLGNRFEVVVSGEDVQHGKPAPDIFLLAAGKLGIPPGNCTVIEDSAHGVRAAKAAGMACVGFRNPNSGDQDLSPADLVVDSFSDPAMEKLLTPRGEQKQD